MNDTSKAKTERNLKLRDLLKMFLFVIKNTPQKKNYGSLEANKNTLYFNTLYRINLLFFEKMGLQGRQVTLLRRVFGAGFCGQCQEYQHIWICFRCRRQGFPE